MRFGVSVYLHREGMLHSKTLTIDDRLAMFGSANYDIRSFELNFELNVLLQASAAVAELYCLQEHYREQSDKATLGDWPTRTLAGRLKVNVAKLLSPLL
jgi:cardiolipin synthase A/B